MSQFLSGCLGPNSGGTGREAKALVCESEAAVSQARRNDGWGTGARVEEQKLGGEKPGKCVAMNPKNGMKRRRNEKRAKAPRVNGGAELHRVKKPARDKGGSERRVNAWTVSGICGMYSSTDVEHLSSGSSGRE